MNNFNNFFDSVGGDEQPRTPIYHTPDPQNDGGHKKTSAVTILFIVIAVLMCIIAVINVVVLAVMKEEIASQYSAKMSDSIRAEYEKAIAEVLKEKDITSDMLATIQAEIIQRLDLTAAETAGAFTVDSTAVIRAYNKDDNKYSTSSGFLITDATSVSGTTTRYLVTNAHCVLYEKRTSEGGWIGGSPTYVFDDYDTIECTFLDNDKTYTLRVVGVGSYKGDYVATADYLTSPDLAVCEFVGDYPDEIEHPSLKIAAADYSEYGDEIAIVGNPAGVGISVSSGCVSRPAETLNGWGYGKFIMTDAAINGGNSGGPMVNRNGVVIGVVESKMKAEEYENMGFAVAASTLIEFLNNVEREAGITIPYLTQGIIETDVTV